MEFVEEKLCKLYDIGSGISITPDKYGYGYPFLTFKDIFNSPYIKAKIETLVDSTEKDRKSSSINKGDVFLTRTSETAEELGMSTVALKDYPNATFNGFSKRLRPKTDEIDPLYAAYFFRIPYFRAQTYAMASIITRASLNNSNISHLKIRYPKSKEIQHKIGECLYNYDAIIEINESRITLLESLAESLYLEWFVNLRFPGYKSVEMIDAKPSGWCISGQKKHCIPFGFKYGELRELGEFVRGKNITSAQMVEGSIPVISAGLEPSGYHNVANVFGDSLTVSSSGANAGFMKYNLGDIWAADCSYYQNEDNIWFVYSTLKYLQPVISNMQCGAAQPHVYPKHINKMNILIPNIELIKKYNVQVKEYFEEIKILRRENDLLIKQRNLIMPRLLTGKIEL